MSLANYRDIVAASHGAFVPVGFDGDFDLPSSLFPHQRASVEFSLRAGSSAMFLDTGLGKTRAALSWGQEVVSRTNRPVLMLAPLGVTRQHKREADEIGIDAVVSRDGGPQDAQIVITNYERLHLFDAGKVRLEHLGADPAAISLEVDPYRRRLPLDREVLELHRPLAVLDHVRSRATARPDLRVEQAHIDDELPVHLFKRAGGIVLQPQQIQANHAPAPRPKRRDGGRCSAESQTRPTA